jgi:hypothetical protein
LDNGAVPSVLSEFANDLKQALNAWKSSPWLPVTSLCVALLGQVEVLVSSSALAFVALFASLFFSIGYVGTERIWYLRIFSGKSLTPNRVLELSWDFLGRYLVLGLMFFWPVWVFTIGGVLLLHGAKLPVWYWVGAYCLVTAADFALTFVTPALAYSTRKATQATRIGMGMIREYWPATATYVLVPPLAILLLARFNPQHLNPAGVVLTTAASTLLNLLMKGATAAFYLRRHPAVSDYGAVRLAWWPGSIPG